MTSRKRKPFGHHANHCGGLTSETNGSPHDVRVAGKAILPDTIANNENRWRSGKFILYGETSPKQRSRAEEFQYRGRKCRAAITARIKSVPTDLEYFSAVQRAKLA